MKNEGLEKMKDFGKRGKLKPRFFAKKSLAPEKSLTPAVPCVFLSATTERSLNPTEAGSSRPL